MSAPLSSDTTSPIRRLVIDGPSEVTRLAEYPLLVLAVHHHYNPGNNRKLSRVKRLKIIIHGGFRTQFNFQPGCERLVENPPVVLYLGKRLGVQADGLPLKGETHFQDLVDELYEGNNAECHLLKRQVLDLHSIVLKEQASGRTSERMLDELLILCEWMYAFAMRVDHSAIERRESNTKPRQQVHLPNLSPLPISGRVGAQSSKIAKVQRLNIASVQPPSVAKVKAPNFAKAELGAPTPQLPETVNRIDQDTLLDRVKLQCVRLGLIKGKTVPIRVLFDIARLAGVPKTPDTIDGFKPKTPAYQEARKLVADWGYKRRKRAVE